MNAIIFGANGQDGYYLKRVIEKDGGEIIGVSRSSDDHIKGDVSNYEVVEKLIRVHQPDFIFHLAANSTTSHDALFENHQTIATGTINILEAVNRFSKHTKVFISGSGLQFVNNGTPIDESFPFEARDAYSVARIHAVYAARYYRSIGLSVYVGYFFNHDSPLRPIRHINQMIVQTVNRIALGSDEILEIGNGDVKKEFTFAGDSMDAIWTLVNNDLHRFESVIGSGKAYSIIDWLTICFNKKGLKWEDHVTIKKGFKSEYEILISNPKTIFSLGWKPSVDIEELAEIMLNNTINVHGKK